MYAGSIEDDIKQLRMIQRACRRFGLEYAEFPEGDSDGFFSRTVVPQPENKGHHHVSAVQVAADPGPTTHVIIAVG
jgi:hypothetical protein